MAKGQTQKVDDNKNRPLYVETKYLYRDCAAEAGRWKSRDPFGEQASANIYAFLNNNGVDQMDYLGECCCCAYGLQLIGLKPFNDGSSFGHDFSVDISLEYKACGSGDCTFTWKEKSNRPPPDIAALGAQPDVQYNVTAMGGTLPKIKWDTHADACPGFVGVRIPDTPQIPLNAGSIRRVLEFEMTLTSSTGSTCDHKSLTITATQTLEVSHRGAILTQQFSYQNPAE